MKHFYTAKVRPFAISALFILLFTLSGFAQIGIGTTTPKEGSILDVESLDKGIYIPRISLTNSNTLTPITGVLTPANAYGLLVYNTNPALGVGLFVWTGAQWISVGNGSNDDWKIGGNGNTTNIANFLGTINNEGIRIKTNSFDRFNISSGTTVANGGRLWAYADGLADSPIYSWNADSNTGMYRIANDILGFSTNSIERFRLGIAEAVFNDPSQNYDYRIESDGQQNMFFVDASTNRIGIQTNVPANTFHILNSGNIGATAMGNFENTGTNGVALSSYNTSTANAYNGFEGVTNGIYTGVAGLALTQGAGGDGVWGGTNDWQSIGVVGTRFNSGGVNLGFGGFFFDDLGYTGGLYTVSDRRLKKNIQGIHNALDIVEHLNPVTYDFKTDEYPNMGLNNISEIGFIAQEVQNILPTIVKEKSFPINGAAEIFAESVSEHKTENMLTIDYTRIIPILTKAIQEQQQIIESQNKRIEALERAIKD